MATAHKRTRRKTGPNSWLNITTRANGTTTTSSSTRVAGRTTTITPKGVRKTQNNNGWVVRTFTPTFKKPKSKSSASYKAAQRRNEILWAKTITAISNMFNDDGKRNKMKNNSPNENNDVSKLDDSLSKLEEKLDFMDMDKWSKEKIWKFIGITIVACIVLQTVF